MTDTIITAFDPGGVTGVATLYVNDNSIRRLELDQLGPEEHHLKLSKLLGLNITANPSRHFIICERFDYRAYSRAGLRLDSREYIGVIKQFGQQYCVPVVMQSAAQAKGFVKDEHIKRAGFYQPAKRHAMDAIRHLMYFVINDEQFKSTMLPYETSLRKDLLETVYKN